MKEIHCRDCGKVTELRDVAPAALHCGSCGKKWDYLTNSIDADISCACANCGAEMRSWWEPKKKMYLPPK